MQTVTANQLIELAKKVQEKTNCKFLKLAIEKQDLNKIQWLLNSNRYN